MKPRLWIWTLGSLLTLGSIVTGSTAEQPWDGPAFSADPAAIIRAAAAIPVPEDAPAELLLEQSTYRFDEQGRREHTLRCVFRCLTEVGAKDWSLVEAAWSPWCEEKPSIRARVITPDGKAHPLDPESIGEVPLERGSPDVLSDRRMLRAPLPAIAVGAVVEQQIVTRESRPFFAQGTVEHVALARFFPVRKLQLVIDAPAELPVRYEVRASALKPVRTEQGGRVRWCFETGPVEALSWSEFEVFRPPENPLWPEVAFSTGKSWAEVGSGYAALVDGQIDPAAVKTMVHELVGEQKDRLEVATALTGEVRKLIRYTGVEFGEAAIVPRTPGETLKRRYGDCKDQSTLLVAMLRAAGLPAHVALLNNESLSDVVPGLPGLGLFDHAIVYVPGDPALWIDPTARYVPVGELPLEDQGRWALPAGSADGELVRTPRADSQHNRVAERFEYRLMEWEGDRLRETITATGSCAVDLRTYYATDAGQLRKDWQDYAREEYGSASLSKCKHTSPGDLSEPFRVDVEILDARVDTGDEARMEVALFPSLLFDGLPRLFFTVDSEEEDPDDDGSEPAGRKAPLVLTEPHLREQEYRVTAPPGFAPAAPPESWSRQFGPATLGAEFEVQGDDTILATFRFDTGDGRFTPGEFESLKRGIAELAESGNVDDWLVTLAFDHVAGQHLAAGRMKEALACYGSLLQDHPDLAVLHARYASALLQAGLGEAARDRASRAVALAPKSAHAHYRRALILTHDLLGQHFRPGIDWSGADEAYRKAIELDPSDQTVRLERAILLEYGPNAARYAPDAKLDEAVAEYREVRKKLGTLDTLDINYALVLLYTGQYAQLETLAAEMGSLHGEPLLVAAVAAQRGPAVAQQKALRLCPDVNDRRLVLIVAGDYLSKARLYPQARAMVEAAAAGAPNGPQLRAFAAVLAKVQRIDEAELPEDDPRHPVQQFVAAAVAGREQDPQLPSLFVKSATREDLDSSTLRIRRAMGPVLDIVRQMESPPQRTADFTSVLDMTAKGDDDAGYRITIADPRFAHLSWYVVAEQGAYRLLPAGRNQANLGAMALKCLADDDLENAQGWLNRAWLDQKDKSNWLDPFSGSPFYRLWWMADREDPEKARLAAAALLARGTDPKPAIAILTGARDHLTFAAEKLQVDRALSRAYITADRPEAVLEVVDRILQKHDSAEKIVLRKTFCLRVLKRSDDLQQWLQSLLEKTDLSPITLAVLATQAANSGHFPIARQLLAAAAKDHELAGFDKVLLASIAVVEGQVRDRDLENALAAAQRTGHRNREHLYLLANCYAEMDKPAEAAETLRQRVNLLDGHVDAGDWYVLGRIAEQYQLPEIAIDLYRKVSEPTGPTTINYYACARRRLKELGQ